MIAMNLQMSFLTPPFGFALFYLRGVTPKEIPTSIIYKGAIPFIVIQAIGLLSIMFFPELVLQR
jgi:TRAP-type mannitol/chloroaromatic compound transport system permease large subunit